MKATSERNHINFSPYVKATLTMPNTPKLLPRHEQPLLHLSLLIANVRKISRKDWHALILNMNCNRILWRNSAGSLGELSNQQSLKLWKKTLCKLNHGSSLRKNTIASLSLSLSPHHVKAIISILIVWMMKQNLYKLRTLEWSTIFCKCIKTDRGAVQRIND